MPDTWPARRLPDDSDLDALERPGDYFLGSVTGYADEPATRRALSFLLPTAEVADPWRVDHSTREAWAATRANGLHRITEPPWTFTEQPDGTVEVRASIACGRHDAEGEYFHGYLDAGNVWRSC